MTDPQTDVVNSQPSREGPARPKPRPAAPELEILRQTEELAAWLFCATARWPKRLRSSLTARIEQAVLTLLEHLTHARYRRTGRLATLDTANHVLEHLRRLLRLAHTVQACQNKTFEQAMRRIDEIGRMLFGWRTRLKA